MKIKLFLFSLTFLVFSFSKIYANYQPNPKSIDGLYKFMGKLNGKIPVFLWFVLKDSVLKGEVTYLKTAKRQPIAIAGHITKDWGMDIYEFTPKGYVTGIYRGAFNHKELTGKWFAPGANKELYYTLASKDTVVAPVDLTLKPGLVNGTYEYHFEKEGTAVTYGDGGIDIKQTSPNNFLIEISCVTASPANNLANLETFKAKMINGTIIFTIPEADCKYKIRPYNGFIVIDRIAGSGNCGFGMNADVTGVFYKTSDKATVYQVR